jgi:hypothetical protein
VDREIGADVAFLKSNDEEEDNEEEEEEEGDKAERRHNKSVVEQADHSESEDLSSRKLSPGKDFEIVDKGNNTEDDG